MTWEIIKAWFTWNILAPTLFIVVIFIFGFIIFLFIEIKKKGE